MNNVIRDVVCRTSGELFIGVVGAVRTGKSTFIRKFIENKVAPYIDDIQIKNKLIDELPLSGEGKTIMTVEPKFVPSNPVFIKVCEEISLNVRLVDCVGYIIPSSKGYINDDGTPRLVKTPWQEDSMEFSVASELGTKKVMENHSHIGIVLTSDGTFTDFTKEEYEEVLDRLVNEMKNLNKPFVIVLNTKEINEQSNNYVEYLKNKYDVNTICVEATNLSNDDIDNILMKALEEFSITKLDLNMPTWLKNLSSEFEIKQKLNDLIDTISEKYKKFKDITNIKDALIESNIFTNVEITSENSGLGEISFTLDVSDDIYTDIIKKYTGDIIDDKDKFLEFIKQSVISRNEYQKYFEAINCAKQVGYGVAIPETDDLTLYEPEILKNGNRYGIKLKAKGESIHMIKVDIESTFEPIIGSAEQSKMLLEKLVNDYNVCESQLLNSLIFGRKLVDVISDGIKGKLYTLNDDVKNKFKESLEKVVNKNRGGLIAIIL